jgi:hypothetical protein
MPTKKKNVCEKLENLTLDENMMKEQGTTTRTLFFTSLLCNNFAIFYKEIDRFS